MIGNYGAPWGGSSTAIIAGIGIRLLNQSLHLSQVDLSLHEEVRKCFSCCDQDDQLLKKSLAKQIVNLNESTMMLLQVIVSSLEKVKGLSDKIDTRYTSDFVLGKKYCFTALDGCFELIKANGLDEEDAMELLKIENRITNLT